MNDNVITQWENVATTYSNEQSTSINATTNKQIIKEILGDPKNLTILDAGCGDGSFANELKNLGAKVSAFDSSKHFIEIAKNNFKNIDFQICNIKDALPYNTKSFDVIISSLVLMDIDNIETFFKETHRILKDNGRLIFSIVHPCFFQGNWELDNLGNKISKKISDYWDQNLEILNIWGETSHFHRPISWYSDMIYKGGFLIENLKENPDDAICFNNLKSHQKRLPLFLCFSLRKNPYIKNIQ